MTISKFLHRPSPRLTVKTKRNSNSKLNSSSGDDFIDHNEWTPITKAVDADNGMPIFDEVLVIVQIVRDAMDSPLNLVNPTSAHDAMTDAEQALSQTEQDSITSRNSLYNLTNYLLEICDGPLSWINEYPELNESNEDEISDLVEESIQTCEEAEGKVLEVQVQIGSVQDGLFNYKTNLQLTEKELENDKKRAEDQHDSNIETQISEIPGIPWYEYLIIGVAVAHQVAIDIQEKEIRETQDGYLDEDTKTLNSWINQVETLLNDDSGYIDSAEEFISVASDIATTLGDVMENLTTMQSALQLSLSAASNMYAEFLKLQWAELKENALKLESLFE